MIEADTKKIEEAKQWLDREVAKDNPLAQSFFGLLSNAVPETQSRHYLSLHQVLQATKLIAESVRNQK